MLQVLLKPAVLGREGAERRDLLFPIGPSCLTRAWNVLPWGVGVGRASAFIFLLHREEHCSLSLCLGFVFLFFFLILAIASCLICPLRQWAFYLTFFPSARIWSTFLPLSLSLNNSNDRPFQWQAPRPCKDSISVQGTLPLKLVGEARAAMKLTWCSTLNWQKKAGLGGEKELGGNTEIARGGVLDNAS